MSSVEEVRCWIERLEEERERVSILRGGGTREDGCFYCGDGVGPFECDDDGYFWRRELVLGLEMVVWYVVRSRWCV